MKKKVKEVEGEHRKMLQIALVLEDLLAMRREHHYSSSMLYFLVHTLGLLVTRNLSKLEDYLSQKE